MASSPSPSPSSRSRKIPTSTVPPRSSSPTGSVSTAKSAKSSVVAANSPRPVPARKSYRSSRGGGGGTGVANTGLRKSTSNSSISLSNSGNVNVNNVSHGFPERDGTSTNNSFSTTPLPTPTAVTGNNNSNIFDETTTLTGSSSSPNQSQNPNNNNNNNNNKKSNTIRPDPQNPDHRRSLPHPQPPSRCPLLCVFYAEFDIVVGPKVCFQSPQKFMHFDVDVSFEDVHHALEETFQAVIPKEDDNEQQQQQQQQQQQPVMAGGKQHNGNNDKGKKNHQLEEKSSMINSEYVHQLDSDDYWSWSPSRKTTIIEQEGSDISSQITLPRSGHRDDKHYNTSVFNTSGSASGTEGGSTGAKSTLDEFANNNTTNTSAHFLSSHSRNPSFASSSKGTTSNPPTHEGDTSTIDTELLQNSIFAATSEYIITGNELANQTITVSTHGMHILSRPMIICDTTRYERNSLLFAVGFVLRRNVDPRPYWPVLSNLSSTFRSMEVESEFLSHHRTRPQVQVVLEDMLVSLNSRQRDCHLVLDDANMLNVQLFRPPPPPTPPVPDYAVPILLRPEWQLQMYDWDLTINWIVPHIDGCKYVKQIAISSEVDMEMVRACLRVLRHHGVLAYVDVFRYCNVYECTPLAVGLSTGTGIEADEAKDAAFWYSAKAKHVRRAQRAHRAAATNGTGSDRNSPSFSPGSNAARGRLHPHMSSLHSLDLSVHSSIAAATPSASAILAETTRRRSMTEELPRSFPSRTEHITIREEHSIDEDASLEIGSKRATGNGQGGATNSPESKQIDLMKKALAQLYSSCSRNQSFGEMLLAKIENKADTSPSEEHANEKSVAKNFVEATLTPLHEASESETVASSLAKNDNQKHGAKVDKEFTDDTSIDWRTAFDYFDHRRLITFGLVRGLIRRVHQYPLAYEVGTQTDEANGSSRHGQDTSSHGNNDDDDDESDDFIDMEMSPEPYRKMPKEMPTMAEAAAAAAKTAFDERSRTPSYSASPLPQHFDERSSRTPSYSASPSPHHHGFPTPSLPGRDEILLNKLTRKEMELRSRKLLLERMALAMDGTRCDDELSCMFEIPIEKLIEMLKDTRKWNVISVFSCTS